jgi:hypothetical protein
MGSRRVRNPGLGESAAEPTAAIDSESPLVEVTEKHRVPKCEKTRHQQQKASGEHQQASSGHIRQCGHYWRR